jgi:hypothetical protein
MNNTSGKKVLNYKSMTLPHEIVNMILEYDGQIKYKYKDKNRIDYNKYINIIHKNDPRYNIIKPVINKNLDIFNKIHTSMDNNKFYFEFSFNNEPMLNLCYDYNWSYDYVFEICYTDMKSSGHILGSEQIRTIYE